MFGMVKLKTDDECEYYCEMDRDKLKNKGDGDRKVMKTYLFVLQQS